MIITDENLNIEKIIDSGQVFRAIKLCDKIYRFISCDKILYLKEISNNTYALSCTDEEWSSFWSQYFDMNRDYNEIISRINKNDEYACKCAFYSKGIRILHQEPWEMLISFIISQRKSIPAIRSSIEMICEMFGKCVDMSETLLDFDNTLPQEILSLEREVYLFPSPVELKEATDAQLRECKTGYRAPYILDAIAVCNNSNDFLYKKNLEDLSDENLLDYLMQIKGVGLKVASCIALFAYSRVNLAPVDTWIQKIIDKYYKGENPFPKYPLAPGIIQQYMFYYALCHKDEF